MNALYQVLEMINGQWINSNMIVMCDRHYEECSHYDAPDYAYQYQYEIEENCEMCDN